MIPGFPNFPEGQIIVFALIFLRVIAFVVAWPIFGTNQVPVPVKVLLAIVLSIVLFPIVKLQNVDLLNINDQLIFMSVRELFVGLCLGFMLRFFFFSVSIAGEMIGVSSGLSSAQIFNPSIGSQTNVMEQIHWILATLFLLAMNGHHLFIQGLAQSFDLVPISDIAVKYKSFSAISLAVKDAFFIGIKMASPVVVAVFITNLTMGLLGRTVPQINVMMTSFQVTILIAMGVFFIMMPLFVEQMNSMMQVMFEKFFSVMKVI